MELHEITPLRSEELQFCELYLKTATEQGFDPLQADFADYMRLREAMLPDLDAIMAQSGELWHRMAAYLPDTLHAGDLSDFRYVRGACYARYIPMAEHACESYEIILCPYGSNLCYVDREPVQLIPGDVLILAPGALFATGAFDEKCIRRSILLRRLRTKEHFPMLLNGDGPLARFLRHTVDGHGGNSWCRFRTGDALLQDPWAAALYRLPPSNDPMRVALENGLLMSFLANLELNHSERVELRCCEFSSVEEAIFDCLQHEFATIDRKQLAERFGYSERQLLRIIQRRTGLSFQAYLTQLRLDYVADMLVNSYYPIKTIMESAGYENNSGFYELFRSKFEMSPKDFRAKYR